MAKPELGTKRLCPGCGAKFYDLSKDPIVCPKCDTVFVAAPVVSRSRPDAAPRAVPPPRPRRKRCLKRRRPSSFRSKRPTPRPRAPRSPAKPPKAKKRRRDRDRHRRRRFDLPRGARGRGRRRHRHHRRRHRERGGDLSSRIGSGPASRPWHEVRRRVLMPDPRSGRGHSSAGRAPAWHAGGQRFDPAWLHQPSLEERRLPQPKLRSNGGGPTLSELGSASQPTSSRSWLWMQNMIGRIGTIATLAGSAVAGGNAGAQADKRVALVIGNSSLPQRPGAAKSRQ